MTDGDMTDLARRRCFGAGEKSERQRLERLMSVGLSSSVYHPTAIRCRPAEVCGRRKVRSAAVRVKHLGGRVRVPRMVPRQNSSATDNFLWSQAESDT